MSSLLTFVYYANVMHMCISLHLLQLPSFLQNIDADLVSEIFKFNTNSKIGVTTRS